MPDYQELYHFLFNAVTDAVELMNEGNIFEARDVLKKAQCDAEELYLRQTDENNLKK